MPTKQTPEACAIFGAGGHGKVVYDALLSGQPNRLVHVYDDAPERAGQTWLNTTIQRFDPNNSAQPSHAHIAIGSNQTRCDRTRLWLEHGGTNFSVFHPDAIIANSANIKTGAFIAARSIIGPDAKIAEGVIINHAAIIDHDCQISAWAHIAPNATLGGGVHIGTHCLIGATATILPGCQIGDGATIGAGAVVTHNIAAGNTVIGCPARPIQSPS